MSSKINSSLENDQLHEEEEETKDILPKHIPSPPKSPSEDYRDTTFIKTESFHSSRSDRSSSTSSNGLKSFRRSNEHIPKSQPRIPLSKPLPEPGNLKLFYLRYYSGISAGFSGNEYLEFVFDNQEFRYTNLSKYHRNMKPIRRSIILSKLILKYLQQIILNSNILTSSDETWPYPTETSGTEELEVNYEGVHISFITAKIGSITDLDGHKDETNLKSFFYLIRDLKKLGFGLVKAHFRIQEYV